MSTNPYAPPKSEVELEEQDVSESVPEDVRKQIKQAWAAGLVSAAITLLVTLLAMSGIKIMSFSAWELIDVALILGLTYGIYRKSRACALLMLVYFLISKALLFAQDSKPNGIVMSLIFGYCYVQGVRGTFAYHKHIRQALAPRRESLNP